MTHQSKVKIKRLLKKNQYILGKRYRIGKRGYSSGVEHSTADREVPGSIAGVPLPFLFFWYYLISAVGPFYFLDIENSKTIPPEILKILETDQSHIQECRIGCRIGCKDRIFRISGGIVLEFSISRK